MGEKALPCNDLIAVENLYSKSEGLPVKVAKFAIAHSALSRFPECVQGGKILYYNQIK